MSLAEVLADLVIMLIALGIYWLAVAFTVFWPRWLRRDRGAMLPPVPGAQGPSVMPKSGPGCGHKSGAKFGAK
jgi:hypothetical protein